MKFLTLATLLIFTALGPASAQFFSNLNRLLTMGVDVRTYAVGGITNGTTVALPLAKRFSIGGYFDYGCDGQQYGDHRWKYQFLALGVRATYHLANQRISSGGKAEPYAGLSLSIRGNAYRAGAEAPVQSYRTGLLPGLYAGTRYRLSKTMDGFAEVSSALTTLRLGFTARL